MLRTRGGEDIDTLGGEKSVEFEDRVEAMLKNPKQGPLALIDSNWPFALALGGFSLVFVLFGAAAAHFSSKET